MPRALSAPPTSDPGVVGRVRSAVAACLSAACDADTGLVLAVSGGRDSTVLLDAVLAVARDRVLVVATFDHGTGDVARQAVRHVRALARTSALPVRVGRLRAAASEHAARPAEAGWRAARWTFLRRVARGARRERRRVLVATGHTADDQMETVAMRLLRGAGARGVAGMYAPTAGVVRPLLATAAADVAAYAHARGLAWVDDPTNASPRHLRNRLRYDLLPALTLVRPGLGEQLLDTAREAARWRQQVAAAAATLMARHAGAPGGSAGPGVVASLVRLADLAEYDEPAWGVLWPALLARAGVRVDRRGTARLTAFTTRCVSRVASGHPPGGSAPLAGGVRVVLERVSGVASPEWAMVVRRGGAQGAGSTDATPLALVPGAPWAEVGRWRFRLEAVDGGAVASVAAATRLDTWAVCLAADRSYAVRSWRPGDRWRASPGQTARRVKRFFADLHVPAADRAGWPVVVAHSVGASDAVGGEIVWIPGVRRAPAAPARPGAPGLVLVCHRLRERRPDLDR